MRIAVLVIGGALCLAFFFGSAALAGDTAAQWNKEGNKAFRAKKYEEAVAFYSNALQADSQCVQALYNRGLAYYRLGQINNAWNDLTKVHEVNPDHHKAANLLGLIELKRGYYDAAFGKFRQAAQTKEKSKYFFNAALAAYKAGFYDVAIEYGRDALVADPKNERALKLITVSKKTQERIAEARADLLAVKRAKEEEALRLAAAKANSGSYSGPRGSTSTSARRTRRKG